MKFSSRALPSVGSALAIAALTTGLVACDSNDESTGGKSGDEALGVVATTTQICDYVHQITDDMEGDAKIDLTCLLAPNASAHEHEMTRDQMDALSDADVLLMNGVSLEAFLDDAIESSGFEGEKVDTSEGVKLEHWPFPPEDGESEPEFEFDPHVWSSPKGAIVQAKNVGKALEEADSDNADAYKKATDDYVGQLEDLDAWAAESINSVPKEDRILFTSHDAFGYFARDYDVDFIGAALSDFNSQQDATAEHIQEGAKQVKDSGTKVLFPENSNSSRSIEAVARAADVKIGDELYGDSLGPDVTYVESIEHNIEALIDGWDGKLADMPESLS